MASIHCKNNRHLDLSQISSINWWLIVCVKLCLRKQAAHTVWLFSVSYLCRVRARQEVRVLQSNKTLSSSWSVKIETARCQHLRSSLQNVGSWEIKLLQYTESPGWKHTCSCRFKSISVWAFCICGDCGYIPTEWDTSLDSTKAIVNHSKLSVLLIGFDGNTLWRFSKRQQHYLRQEGCIIYCYLLFVW